MYKVDLLRLLRRLGIVQLPVVCGKCVWSSWCDFDILRSPIAWQWSTGYIWQGESNSTLGPLVFLYFSLCFTNIWRDLWGISWNDSLSKSGNSKAISLWHDKDESCRYWSKCLRHTLLLPLQCVFKAASPWCLRACSLPRPRPLPWQCSKCQDLGIEAVNGEPSIHAYPSFSTNAWSSIVLFYSCPEVLVKFKHQRHQRPGSWSESSPVMIPLALAVPYFHLKMERLQTCRLRCLLVRCCEMGRAAVDQAVSSSTGEVVLANFTIHEGELWLINDRGAGLEETGHDNWNIISMNGDMLSLKFERAGFSDHMVPENRTKYYFIHHFLFIKSVWPRFLLLVIGHWS